MNTTSNNQNDQIGWQLQSLNSTGRKLSAINDSAQLEQVYSIVARVILEVQPASQVSIWYYDAATESLRLAYRDGSEAVQLPPVVQLNEGLHGRVTQTKQTLLVPGIDDLEHGSALRALSSEARAWIGTPIEFDLSYYGNLTVVLLEDNQLHQGDQFWFEGLAQQLGTTLYRLEAEGHSREAQIMISIGQNVFELSHRLGSELGLVTTQVNRIKRELARMGVVNQNADKYLEAIKRDVQEVLGWSKELRGDLRTLAEEQATPREQVNLSVQTLLEQTVANTSSIQPAHVDVNFDIEPNIAPVRGVAREIADILRNLYVNAIQAMPDDGGTITLRARNVGRDVEIQVKDTGVGIHAGQLPRIFDLFYSTKGSSGFGLWSARRHALANQGELLVESQPGEGTTFTLVLPSAQGKEAAVSIPQLLQPIQSQRLPPSESMLRIAELEAVVEELKQIDERRARVLSLIAHEVRQPLANIKWYILSLLDGVYDQLNDAQEENLRTVQQDIEAMEQLLETFLARHEIEAGKINLSPKRLNLRRIIVHVVELYAYNAEEGRVMVYYDCDEHLSIVADEVLLKQIIGNLVDNAIKFQPKRTVEVSDQAPGTVKIIATHVTDWIEITVEDNGIGIAPEQIPHIFEWEYRGDDSLTRERGGIGYGLPMVKAYAELHGGTVLASSVINQGSIFKIRLPVRDIPGGT